MFITVILGMSGCGTESFGVMAEAATAEKETAGHKTNLSFLQYMPELKILILVDLNISYNPISDAACLFKLPKPERLFLEHTKIPYSELNGCRRPIRMHTGAGRRSCSDNRTCSAF